MAGPAHRQVPPIVPAASRPVNFRVQDEDDGRSERAVRASLANEPRLAWALFAGGKSSERASKGSGDEVPGSIGVCANGAATAIVRTIARVRGKRLHGASNWVRIGRRCQFSPRRRVGSISVYKNAEDETKRASRASKGSGDEVPGSIGVCANGAATAIVRTIARVRGKRLHGASNWVRIGRRCQFSPRRRVGSISV